MICCSSQTRFFISSLLIYGCSLFWLIKSINLSIKDQENPKSINFLILSLFSIIDSALVLFNFFDTKSVIDPTTGERILNVEIFINSVIGAFLTGFAIGIFTPFTVIIIFSIYFLGIILLLPCKNKNKNKRSFNIISNESSNSLVTV
jgi:hypothetical protein